MWTRKVLDGPVVEDKEESVAKKESVALQPFDGFATVLRESGREDTARKVGVAKEDIISRNIWSNGHLWWPAKSVYWVWRKAIKAFSSYGYNPARAFLSFLSLIVVGSLFFSWGINLPFSDALDGCRGITWGKSSDKLESETQQIKNHEAVKKNIPGVFPTKVYVYTGGQYGENGPKEYLGKKIPSNYPSYCPLIYSLELATPLANLGQGSHWEIEGGHLIDLYRWLHVLLGWFFCLLIVLSPTELLRKD
jgi:hypothetical protein